METFFTIIGAITTLWIVGGLTILGFMAANGRFHMPKGVPGGVLIQVVFASTFLLPWVMLTTGGIPYEGGIIPPDDWEPPHDA